MKEKQGKAVKVLVSLGVVLLGLASSPNKVFAQDIVFPERLVTEVNLQDANGATLLDPVKQWEKIRLEIAFHLDEGEVKSGDEVRLKLPESLRMVSLDRFEIRDDQNRLIAIAQILPGHSDVRITYQESVDQIKESQGTFYLYARINHKVVDRATSLPVEVTVGGDSYKAGHLEFAGLTPLQGEVVTKSGWQKDQAPDRGEFEVSLNRSGQYLKGTKVTESSDKSRYVFDTESFQVFKGRWHSESGEWQLLDQVEITSEVQMEVTTSGYTIFAGDLKPEEGIQIRYETVAHAPLKDGQRLENPVTVTWEEQEVTVDGGYTYYHMGSLPQSGPHGLEVLLFVDPDHPVEGAVLEVIDDETGEVVVQGVTDATGKAVLSGLNQKDYRLRQVFVPEGYERMPDVMINGENFTPENPTIHLAFQTPLSATVRQSMPVRIVWDDNQNRAGVRPDKVNLLLVQNGVEQDQVLTLRETENWEGRFDNLLSEDAIGSYFYSANAFDLPNGYYAQTSVDGKGVTITIKYRY